MVVRAWQTLANLQSGLSIVSSRSGNIIAGGDHAQDRLLPDLIRSFRSGVPARIRSPQALRPWLHALDSLHGYLCIATSILNNEPISNAYNFGPADEMRLSVAHVADLACDSWGAGASWIHETSQSTLPEANLLWLNSDQAKSDLGWSPALNTVEAVQWTIKWEKLVENLGVCGAMDVQIEKYREMIE
jgi:CDP-glucose 4,6-dehydratase